MKDIDGKELGLGDIVYIPCRFNERIVAKVMCKDNKTGKIKVKLVDCKVKLNSMWNWYNCNNLRKVPVEWLI